MMSHSSSSWGLGSAESARSRAEDKRDKTRESALIQFTRAKEGGVGADEERRGKRDWPRISLRSEGIKLKGSHQNKRMVLTKEIQHDADQSIIVLEPQ
jgi:hypothetical protein